MMRELGSLVLTRFPALQGGAVAIRGAFGGSTESLHFFSTAGVVKSQMAPSFQEGLPPPSQQTVMFFLGHQFQPHRGGGSPTSGNSSAVGVKPAFKAVHYH